MYPLEIDAVGFPINHTSEKDLVVNPANIAIN